MNREKGKQKMVAQSHQDQRDRQFMQQAFENRIQFDGGDTIIAENMTGTTWSASWEEQQQHQRHHQFLAHTQHPNPASTGHFSSATNYDQPTTAEAHNSLEKDNDNDIIMESVPATDTHKAKDIHMLQERDNDSRQKRINATHHPNTTQNGAVNNKTDMPKKSRELDEDESFIEDLVGDCKWLPKEELYDLLVPPLLERWQLYNECADEIEEEVFENREEIYRNKMEALQKELKALQDGTDKAFNAYVKELERKRDDALCRARVVADYRRESVRKQYDNDARAINEEFEAGKRNLKNAWNAIVNDRRTVAKPTDPSVVPAATSSAIGSTPTTKEHTTKGKRKGRKDRPLTIAEILRNKLGMLNAVAKRRHAVDRLRDMATLSNVLITTLPRDDIENDLDVIHRNIRSRKEGNDASSSRLSDSVYLRPY